MFAKLIRDFGDDGGGPASKKGKGKSKASGGGGGPAPLKPLPGSGPATGAAAGGGGDLGDAAANLKLLNAKRAEELKSAELDIKQRAIEEKLNVNDDDEEAIVLRHMIKKYRDRMQLVGSKLNINSASLDDLRKEAKLLDKEANIRRAEGGIEKLVHLGITQLEKIEALGIHGAADDWSALISNPDPETKDVLDHVNIKHSKFMAQPSELILLFMFGNVMFQRRALNRDARAMDPMGDEAQSYVDARLAELK